MKENCPYCSKEKSALKNHVRLASGNGHGPSGQYPDDFEPGGTAPANDELPASPVDDTPGTEQEPDDRDEEETVELSPGELENVIQTAEEEAFEAGRETATDEREAIEVESTVEDVEPDSGQNSGAHAGNDSPVDQTSAGCPSCGGSLQYGSTPATTRFLTQTGDELALEPSDGVCEPCDVVVTAEGKTVYGSNHGTETENPPPTNDANDASESGGGGVILLGGALALVATLASALSGGSRQQNDEIEVF